MSDTRPWPRDIALRNWQEQAIFAFNRSSASNFLAVATPGAGKTMFALRVAHALLHAEKVQRVVIVVPTAHLKKQWADAAHKVGLNFDPKWENRLEGLYAPDLHGVVVTYAQVASNPEIFRKFCQASTFVVFDEIHHAGEDKSWGDALQTAFSQAYRRLLLSGTPFRSDNNPIPFVTYEQGRSRPDFSYGYTNALDDKVCRHVWFPSYEGRMDWISGGEYFSATFADEVAEQRQSERLRAAISANSEWTRTVILKADQKLHDLRTNGSPNAGGLIVAEKQWHAKELQELVSQLTGNRASIAISDDPEASDNIEWFNQGNGRWLIAVKMVSEGVDLPRLRVGVFATNTITELFFRQFVGRFVRGSDHAYIFIPSDPRLLLFAQQIMQERDHQWEQAVERLEREARNHRTADDTLGFFIPINVTDVRPDSVVTGDTVLTPQHLAYARSVMAQAGVDMPVEIAAKMLHVAGALKVGRPQETPAAALQQQQRPHYEVKKEVKDAVHKRVHRLHLATNSNLSHADIWSRLKSVDGVDHNEATLDQLFARTRLLDRWLSEVRRAP